jgi:glycosyltransferase 2 family protein
MRLRRWITALLGVAALACVIRLTWSFPWTRTLELLADCNWTLLTAAGIINILSLLAKGGAWHALLSRAAPVSLETAESATVIGAAVNSVSLSISGDVIRAQIAAERDAVPFGTAAAALMVSRVVELVALISLTGMAALVFAEQLHQRVLIGVILLLVGGLVFWCSRGPAQSAAIQTARGWRGEFRNFLRQIRGASASAVAYAMASWVGQWLTYYWSIRATHIQITPVGALAALLAANLAGILRLTPGNIGIMQGSLIVAMRGFGVRPGDALAGGLALQAIQVLPVLAIATALVGRRGIRRIAQRRSEVL